MAAKARKKTVWGIDVASSAIKGVKMRRVGDRVEILAADIVPLEGAPAGSDTPGRDRRIWQALQRFEDKHEIASEHTIIGLPGEHFFTRPFNVFVVGTRSEAEIVRYELEQHVPFGLDAVLWDYERFVAMSPSNREVAGLLFAMKKDVLNNYLLSLSAADIEPDEVQAAPLALYNFVKNELNPAEPVLVVDIGAASTTLLAVDGARYWLRTSRVGGDALTEMLQRAFPPHKVSREDAEAVKMNLARLTRRVEVVERLQSSMRVFISDLHNAMTHLGREHGLKFGRMLLLGGGSLAYSLGRLISEETGVRVVTPAGLGNVSVAKSADLAYINANLPSLATAIGLALQGVGRRATRVNVVGATLTRRRSQTMTKRVAAVALIGVAVFTLLLGGFSTWRAAVLANGADGLERHTRGLSARYRNWQRMSCPGDPERRMDDFAKLAQERGVWLAALNKVAQILPENEKRTVKPFDKMWVLGLKVSPKPGGRIFAGVLDVGTRIRPDGTQLRFAEHTILFPLNNDEHGIFGNARIQQQQRSSDLRFDAEGERERFFLLRVTFDVDTSRIQAH